MNLLIGLFVSGLVGTIVFVILLAIRPISERLFSKAWHYYSLLVPIVFLLGGAMIAPPLMSQAQYFRVDNGGTAPEIYVEIAEPQNHFTASENPVFTEFTVNITPVQENYLLNSEQLSESIIWIVPYMVTFWAVGMILFIGISMVKYLKYRRLLLRQAQHYPYAGCPIPMVISGTAHTPMLIGIIKPVIVIPQVQLRDEELKVILEHEMVHFRRKDLVYKMVGFIANVVHWYNPAAYALNKQLNMLCELSCDEKMASEMNAVDRKFYGETILQMLHYGAEHRSLAGSLMFATNLCSSPKDIKMRLINMMNTKKISKHAAILSLIVGVFVAGIGFVTSYLIDSAVTIYAEEHLILDESDEWLEWYNSLAVQEQAYVSLRPPLENLEQVHTAPVAVNQATVQSPYRIATTIEEVRDIIALQDGTFPTGSIPVTNLEVPEIINHQAYGIIVTEQCLYEALDMLNEAYSIGMSVWIHKVTPYLSFIMPTNEQRERSIVLDFIREIVFAAVDAGWVDALGFADNADEPHDEIYWLLSPSGIYLTEEMYYHVYEEARRVLALHDGSPEGLSGYVYESVRRLFGNQPSTNTALANPFVWPVNGESRITGTFGYRVNPLSGEEEFLSGVEIAARQGTPIVAVGDGYVVSANHSGEARVGEIIIDHGGGYETKYAYFSAMHVEVGQFVRQGQHIADIGMSGLMTGPFLHFEVRIDNAVVNPMPFFE